MTDFFRTVTGAVLLQDWAYAQVKSNPASLLPGLSVALASSVATVATTDDWNLPTLMGAEQFMGAVASCAALWLIDIFFLLWLGTGFFGNPKINVSYVQLLRTISYASAPAIFLPLALIPLDVFSDILVFVISVWVLIAHLVALRVIFDFESNWESLWLILAAGILQSFIALIPILLFLYFL